MATNNTVNVGLVSATGSGKFVGDHSPTIITPIIAQINDANGNPLLGLFTTAASVNYGTLTNGATTQSPVWGVMGSDTNISVGFQAKGLPHYYFFGTATGAAILVLRENTGNGVFGVGLRAPESVPADIVYTLPGTDGTAGQSLVTNGSEILSWGKSFVQQVSTITGAANTGTTTIPIGDSIPTSSQGTQFMSLAVTPQNTANKLRIDVVLIASMSVTEYINVALFQDSGSAAISTAVQFAGVATGPQTVSFSFEMTAGTVSATTFKVRAGPSTAGTMTFNGASGTRIFGGTLASSIIITEFTP